MELNKKVPRGSLCSTLLDSPERDTQANPSATVERPAKRVTWRKPLVLSNEIQIIDLDVELDHVPEPSTSTVQGGPIDKIRLNNFRNKFCNKNST